MLVTVTSIWAALGQRRTCDGVVQAALGWLGGLNAEGAGWARCPSQNILLGQLCLGVTDTEWQVRKAWLVPWPAGMARCLSEHLRWGAYLGQRGKLALTEGRERGGGTWR